MLVAALFSPSNGASAEVNSTSGDEVSPRKTDVYHQGAWVFLRVFAACSLAVAKAFGRVERGWWCEMEWRTVTRRTAAVNEGGLPVELVPK